MEYSYKKKSEFNKIDISGLGLSTPDLQNLEEAMFVVVGKWMMEWIDSCLDSGKIAVGDLLPVKSELAYFLGVSIGTIQNSLRYIEDHNYVESKQRIGTIIKDRSSKNPSFRKHTSKRETAINKIKNYMISNKMKAGMDMPSLRTLATIINYSVTITHSALDYLCSINILEHTSKKPTDCVWKVVSDCFDKNLTPSSMTNATLVDKIEQELKNYINENLNVGDKIPSHSELAKYFKVSVKTVHDALTNLVAQDILFARRGQYGTIVVNMPKDCVSHKKIEKSIFAPAKDTAFYYYEKTQNAIKSMIAERYEIGSKLPSITDLAKEMDLSPNTIRRAFQNLADEGYLVFYRGRYGGTFVVDIPQISDETFRWLSVNPQYAKNYSGVN